MQEWLEKKKKSYNMFKKHFPDARDEKFYEYDADGKFITSWKDTANGEGATRDIWADGNFLVNPETFSKDLKEDLGRRVLFPFTLLLTTETYNLHPTPFNHSTKPVPTDLKIYVTPDKVLHCENEKYFHE